MTEILRTIVDESSDVTTIAPETHALWLQSAAEQNLALQSGSGFIWIGDPTYRMGWIQGRSTELGSYSTLLMDEYEGIPGGNSRVTSVVARVSERTVSTWGTPGNYYDVSLSAFNFSGSPALAITTRKFNSSGDQITGDIPLSILCSGLRVRSENSVHTWYQIDDSSDAEYPDHDFQGAEFNFETPAGVALKIEDDLVTSDVPFKLPSYSVSALPTVVEGSMIYVADAVGAHETGSLCFGNANDWIDVTTGEPVV